LNGNVLLSLQGGMTMAKTDYDGLGTSFAIKPSLTYFFNTKSPHNIGLRVLGTFGYISGSDDNMPITEFVTTIKNFGGGIVYSYHASDAVAPYLFLGVSSLAFDPKFISLDKFHAHAAAAGAFQMLAIQLVFVPAIPAAIDGRDAVKSQFRTLGDGVLAEQVPVKLNGIVHDARHLPDDQVQGDDALRAGLLGVFQGDFEDALDERKFVHR
jgi:hypothetical protein